jgi:hypothetical protein
MTKPKNKDMPKMVRKYVPKIATPTKECWFEVKKKRSLAMDYKQSARWEATRSSIKNKSYREGNPEDFWISSMLVTKFSMQDILLTLMWLNKFLENFLFARYLCLNLSILNQWDVPTHVLFVSFRETRTKNSDPIWAFHPLSDGRINYALHVKNTWVEPHYVLCVFKSFDTM